MLILLRRLGESIHIGDDVIVTLVGIDKGKARIGIDAPKNVPVHREEVWKRIQEQRRAEAEKAEAEGT